MQLPVFSVMPSSWCAAPPCLTRAGSGQEKGLGKRTHGDPGKAFSLWWLCNAHATPCLQALCPVPAHLFRNNICFRVRTWNFWPGHCCKVCEAQSSSKWSHAEQWNHVSKIILLFLVLFVLLLRYYDTYLWPLTAYLLCLTVTLWA